MIICVSIKGNNDFVSYLYESDFPHLFRGKDTLLEVVKDYLSSFNERKEEFYWSQYDEIPKPLFEKYNLNFLKKGIMGHSHYDEWVVLDANENVIPFDVNNVVKRLDKNKYSTNDTSFQYVASSDKFLITVDGKGTLVDGPALILILNSIYGKSKMRDLVSQISTYSELYRRRESFFKDLNK